VISDDAIERLRMAATWPDLGGTRYEIVREIGRGGMGSVYEATDHELGRRVAIKVVEAPSAEARVTAQLEHPGIVPVHDVGTLPDGRAFHVMKLVRGETLSQVPLRTILRICEPVAFAHSRGVVHCDLKPSNIMIGEFGEVLVLDWGIANRRGGTDGYMPPDAVVSPAVDVFALGKILERSTVETRGRESRLQSRRIRAIVAKATDPDPARRYATARELMEDLTRLLDDRDVIAYRESALERVGRWAYRHRELIGIVAAYLIMRAVVLVAFHR